MFYRLSGKSYYAYGSSDGRTNVGSEAYVKADDVKHVENSVELSISNTPQQAKEAYESSKSSQSIATTSSSSRS